MTIADRRRRNRLPMRHLLDRRRTERAEGREARKSVHCMSRSILGSKLGPLVSLKARGSRLRRYRRYRKRAENVVRTPLRSRVPYRPTYRSDRACAPTDGRTFNLARQTTWRWRRWRGPRQRAYRADIYVYTSYLLVQSFNAHKPLI